MSRAPAALIALLAACGSDDDGDLQAGDSGAGDGGGGDGGALAWEEVEVLFEDGEIVTERVKYRSEGLLIDGQVCRPVDGGPHPVVVFNHGGFSGLGLDPMSGNCVDVARSGFVWVGSSYRGEDASEGQIEVVGTATGGTPDEVPDQYEARSPIRFALPDSIPFLVTHGTLDELVPVEQSCALVAGAGGFTSYHLDGSQTEVTSPPAGCGGAGLTWTTGPRPTPDWPGGRYLVVYDDLGHGFAGPAGEAMLADLITFFTAKLPP